MSALFPLAALSGCGGVNHHDRLSWTPPHNSDKATSDWDVAEGVCDKLAAGAQLTQQEVNELADRSNLTLDLLEILNSGEADGDESVSGSIQLVGGVIAFISASDTTTAEEQKKEETFVQCMQDLGWRLQG